jgi:hypothetical protein
VLNGSVGEPVTFDGREWTLERHTPDFSPLGFHQRWLGTFSDTNHRSTPGSTSDG